MTLFRQEVLVEQEAHLYGEATLHRPVSFAVMTALAVVVTLAVMVYLMTVSIPRKDTVSGWIAPAAGMAQVYAPRSGVTSSVEVKLGQEVKAGQVLGSVNLDLTGSNGSLVAQERAQIRARMAEIDFQLAQSTRSHDMELRRWESKATALADEAQNLRGQRSIAAKQLDVLKGELTRIEAGTQKGFISVAERDQRLQAMLAQQQALAELDRQVASRVNEAADARAQAAAVPVASASEISQLRASRSTLEQSLAEADTQAANVIVAPVAGKVAYINMRPGEAVLPTVPLFAVAPANGVLSAELLVPTRSAGFIRKGQSVWLMLDAYPFQRYGAVRGVVDQVSHAAVNPGQIAAPFELKEAVYRVEVTFSQDGLWTHGKGQPLQAGMTLKADIVTDRRTFMQWLLDPVVAATRRAEE